MAQLLVFDKLDFNWCTVVGYESLEYAASLAGSDRPIGLRACKGWLLRQSIADTPFNDARGCYPLFCCEHWDRLDEDILALPSSLVSVTIVTDPLAVFSVNQLRAVFPEVCREYKKHFVAELNQPLTSVVSSHHYRNAKKGLAAVSVVQCAGTLEDLSTWHTLYANLIERHQIRPSARISTSSLYAQFAMPGSIVLAAKVREETVGMIVWVTNGDKAYYHLAAYSDKGYDLRASYALFWRSFELLSHAGVQIAVLGTGAGILGRDDGLTRFKAGWSTDRRTVYLAGRIVNPSVYATLSRVAGCNYGEYFPAYRYQEIETPRVANTGI